MSESKPLDRKEAIKRIDNTLLELPRFLFAWRSYHVFGIGRFFEYSVLTAFGGFAKLRELG